MMNRARSPEEIKRFQQAELLLKQYLAVMTAKVEADIEILPASLLLERVSLPTTPEANSSLAQTLHIWLQKQVRELLAEVDPITANGASVAIDLLFFRSYYTEPFLTRSRICNDEKPSACQFPTLTAIQTEWEHVTGLSLAQLTKIKPHPYSASASASPLPMTERSVTNRIRMGVKRVFGIVLNQGRAHLPALSISAPLPPSPTEAPIIEEPPPTQQTVEPASIAVKETAVKPSMPTVLDQLEDQEFSVYYQLSHVPARMTYSPRSAALICGWTESDMARLIRKFMQLGLMQEYPSRYGGWELAITPEWHSGIQHVAEAGATPLPALPPSKQGFRELYELWIEPESELELAKMIFQRPVEQELIVRVDRNPWSGSFVVKAESRLALRSMWQTSRAAEIVVTHYSTLKALETWLLDHNQPLWIDLIPKFRALEHGLMQWERWRHIRWIWAGLLIALVPIVIFYLLGDISRTWVSIYAGLYLSAGIAKIISDRIYALLRTAVVQICWQTGIQVSHDIGCDHCR